MIHVISSLLLCNLIALKAEAQSIFKKTDAQVFSELKAIKNSAKQMDFIDREIDEYLSHGTYTERGAKNLVRLRESLCGGDPARCLNASWWNKRSCVERSDANKNEIQALLWRSLHSSIKNEKDLDLFLNGLSDCIGALNFVQLRTAADLALAIEQGAVPADSFKVLKWIEAKAISLKRPDVFSLFEKALDDLRKEPVPVQLIASLSVIPLRTMTVKRYVEIAADTRKRNSLASYLNSISFEASMTGFMGELNAFIDRFPNSISSLNTNDEIGLASLRCVQWVATGNSRRCETLLNDLHKKTETTPALKVNWGLAMARFYYLVGQPDRASALVHEMMEIAKKHDLSAVMPLLYYSLSNYLPLTGRFGEGRNALGVFKSGTLETNMGWIKVILFTREQAISFMEGRCHASISAGESGRAHLSQTALGPSSELMWIDLMQLMCFAALNDSPKTMAAHNRIRAYLSRMPDLSYMQTLEQAVMERVQGRDSARSLAEVRTRIGNKHPDIVLIELGLKRIH